MSDGCPEDENKAEPGQCGCGVADTVSDGDGTADCLDLYPDNDKKVVPGRCGCGLQDVDRNGDGLLDCYENPSAILPPLQVPVTLGEVISLTQEAKSIVRAMKGKKSESIVIALKGSLEAIRETISSSVANGVLSRSRQHQVFTSLARKMRRLKEGEWSEPSLSLKRHKRRFRRAAGKCLRSLRQDRSPTRPPTI